MLLIVYILIEDGYLNYFEIIKLRQLSKNIKSFIDSEEVRYKLNQMLNSYSIVMTDNRKVFIREFFKRQRFNFSFDEIHMSRLFEFELMFNTQNDKNDCDVYGTYHEVHEILITFSDDENKLHSFEIFQTHHKIKYPKLTEDYQYIILPELLHVDITYNEAKKIINDSNITFSKINSRDSRFTVFEELMKYIKDEKEVEVCGEYIPLDQIIKSNEKYYFINIESMIAFGDKVECSVKVYDNLENIIMEYYYIFIFILQT